MKKLQPPKNKLGYTEKELTKILKSLKIDKELFNEKFGVNTCGVLPNGEIAYYQYDVEVAIRCCLEGRDKYFWEWD